MRSPAVKAKAEKLIQLQQALGFSDQAMADKVRCTRQTWRNAIEGENVSAGFIARVSVAFQVPFDTYFQIAESQELAA